tara:strand:+ start:248 stop:808 length:561 start_codon:yes stop_codon:yes gene_type:complete
MKILIIPFSIILTFQCSSKDQNFKNFDKTEYIYFLEKKYSQSKVLFKNMADSLSIFVPDNAKDLPDKYPLEITFIELVLPEIRRVSGFLEDIRFALIMDQYGSFDDINEDMLIKQYIEVKVKTLQNIRETLKQGAETMTPFTNQGPAKKLIDINDEMILLIENVVLKLSGLPIKQLIESKLNNEHR